MMVRTLDMLEDIGPRTLSAAGVATGITGSNLIEPKGRRRNAYLAV